MAINIEYSYSMTHITATTERHVDVSASRAIALARKRLREIANPVGEACAQVGGYEPFTFTILAPCDGGRPCVCQARFGISEIPDSFSPNGSEDETFTDSENPDNDIEENRDVKLSFGIGGIWACKGQRQLRLESLGPTDTGDPGLCFDQTELLEAEVSVEVNQAGFAGVNPENENDSTRRYADQTLRFLPSVEYPWYTGNLRVNVAAQVDSLSSPPVNYPAYDIVLNLNGPLGQVEHLDPWLQFRDPVTLEPVEPLNKPEVVLDGVDGVRLLFTFARAMVVPPVVVIPAGEVEEYAQPFVVSIGETAAYPQNRIRLSAFTVGALAGGGLVEQEFAEIGDPCAGDYSFTYHFEFEAEPLEFPAEGESRTEVFSWDITGTMG